MTWGQAGASCQSQWAKPPARSAGGAAPRAGSLRAGASGALTCHGRPTSGAVWPNSGTPNVSTCRRGVTTLRAGRLKVAATRGIRPDAGRMSEAREPPKLETPRPAGGDDDGSTNAQLGRHGGRRPDRLVADAAVRRSGKPAGTTSRVRRGGGGQGCTAARG